MPSGPKTAIVILPYRQQMLRAGIEKYRVFKVPTFLPKLMTADGSFHAQARFIQKQTFFMR